MSAEAFSVGDRVLVHDSIDRAVGTVVAVHPHVIAVRFDSGPTCTGAPFHYRRRELTPIDRRAVETLRALVDAMETPRSAKASDKWLAAHALVRRLTA